MRHHHGAFIVRAEDIDRTRFDADMYRRYYDDLAWAGVEYDEGGELGGPFAPYVQSQRLDAYRQHADRLIEMGRAYPCFCSAESLVNCRTEHERIGRRVGYDRRCANLGAVGLDRMRRGEPHSVRMRVPIDGAVTVHDLIHGAVDISFSTLDDQILLKSDGFPTYHFSSVVDDHIMGMTHVVRVSDWLASTPKHLLLYTWFGWLAPRFAHVPRLPRGNKIFVPDLRHQGIPGAAVANFAITSGWGGGGDGGAISLPDAIAAFELSDLSRSCGQPDLRRLDFLAAWHLRREPPEFLAQSVLPFLQERGLPVSPTDRLAAAMRLIGPRMTTYADAAERFAYLWEAPQVREPLLDLDRVADALDALTEFSAATVESALRGYAANSRVRLGDLLGSVRLALCGTAHTPDIFAVIALLGQSEVLRRLRSLRG